MGRALKIVVADDERDTREYLHELLSSLGHDVRAAGDGLELVRLCAEFCPDLVVSDYAMPGLNGGVAALEINRARPVPVILISGRPELAQLTPAAGSPIVRFLLKPVKGTELVAAVEAVLLAYGDR
jgi:CheY-like chemotaxis protein